MAVNDQLAALCPCCGNPMRVYTQSSVLPSRPPYQLADCWTPGCSLYAVTLTLGEHHKLTAKQRAGYARVNRKHRREQREAARRQDAARVARLSKRQLSALLYIATYWQRFKRSPSIAAVARAHPHYSYSTIQGDIRKLEQIGFVERGVRNIRVSAASRISTGARR